MRGQSFALRFPVIGSILLFMVSSSVWAQGNYAPVTKTDVIEMKLNHYYSADKKLHQADFEWTFADSGFVLKPGQSGIPRDLIEKLLPEGVEAREITGSWSVDPKTGKIHLSEIKAGDYAGREDVELPIYRTAPTVIRVGEPQYVFSAL